MLGTSTVAFLPLCSILRETAFVPLDCLTGSSVNKKLQLNQLKADAGDRRGGRVREGPPDGPEPVRRP